MYVIDYMTAPPVTVGPETAISEARAILRRRRFRHLPVAAPDNKLLGMVTDRDIRSAYPSTVEPYDGDEVERVDARPVAEIMSPGPASLGPGATIDDALLVLERRRVGAVPVLDGGGMIIGIFSIRDLIAAYRDLFGLGERGSALVSVRDDGRPRPLTRIVTALEKNGIHFSRVVRRRGGDGPDDIHVRVNTFNLRAVHTVLEEQGFRVAGPMEEGR